MKAFGRKNVVTYSLGSVFGHKYFMMGGITAHGLTNVTIVLDCSLWFKRDLLMSHNFWKATFKLRSTQTTPRLFSFRWQIREETMMFLLAPLDSVYLYVSVLVLVLCFYGVFE